MMCFHLGIEDNITNSKQSHYHQQKLSAYQLQMSHVKQFSLKDFIISATKTKSFYNNLSRYVSNHMKNNRMFHDRTKHIEIRHHFIKELIEEKKIKLEFIATNNQLANIFIVALPTEKFIHLRTTRNYKLRGGVTE